MIASQDLGSVRRKRRMYKAGFWCFTNKLQMRNYPSAWWNIWLMTSSDETRWIALPLISAYSFAFPFYRRIRLPGFSNGENLFVKPLKKLLKGSHLWQCIFWLQFSQAARINMVSMRSGWPNSVVRSAITGNVVFLSPDMYSTGSMFVVERIWCLAANRIKVGPTICSCNFLLFFLGHVYHRMIMYDAYDVQR